MDYYMTQVELHGRVCDKKLLMCTNHISLQNKCSKMLLVFLLMTTEFIRNTCIRHGAMQK